MLEEFDYEFGTSIKAVPGQIELEDKHVELILSWKNRANYSGITGMLINSGCSIPFAELRQMVIKICEDETERLEEF